MQSMLGKLSLNLRQKEIQIVKIADTSDITPVELPEEAKVDISNATADPVSLPTSLTTDLEAIMLASRGDLIGAFGSDDGLTKSH